jgi:DNA polymerase I
MAAAARMERNGIPIDIETLALLKKEWKNIQCKLIDSIDEKYKVSDCNTFNISKFV